MLKNKVAVIFASTGEISSAVAKEFAKCGAIVCLNGRNIYKLRKLCTDIVKNGGNADYSLLDSTKEKDIDLYLHKIINRYSKLDFVFNGIGIVPSIGCYGTDSLNLSIEKFMKPFNKILTSQFLTSRLAAKYMIRSKFPGTILLLSASLSRNGTPFMAGISSVYSAVDNLASVLSKEWAKYGIKVITLNSNAMPLTNTIKETIRLNAVTNGLKFSDLMSNMTNFDYLTKEKFAFKTVMFIKDFSKIKSGNVYYID